jgi:Leucine-rich repeat (LRR) protein
MSDPTTPELTIPPDIQSRIDSLPDIPPQGFAPHVEYDETGLIVFAPPAALDTEGNNLPRLRNLLPQLLETAAELHELLSRGNQAHAALIRRLAAYRAQLHADLADVTLSRVLAEGIRLENAAAAAQRRIASGDLPPHDEQAQEALDSLLQFHRMFVMATADGPAMLADEARHRRTPEQEEEYQSNLRAFAAIVAESPDAIAPEIGETLTDSLAQPGDTPEAARARRLGDSLAGNIAITVVAGAAVSSIVAGLVTLGPAGIAAGAAFGLLAGKGLEKSKPFAETIAAVGRLYDHATNIEPAAAATRLQKGLARARAFTDRARPTLSALGDQGGRFAWLRRALPWLAGTGATNTPQPPHGFSYEEVTRRLIASEPIDPAWRPFVTKLALGLPRSARAEVYNVETLAKARQDAAGTYLDTVAPVAQFPNLAHLDLWGTKVTDVTPLAVLANLQSLDLRHTRVTDLAPLASLTALQFLDVQHAEVTDLAPLAGLSALQILNLGRIWVTDLAPLASLTTLESLDLQVIGATDLAPITSLTALQSLHLRVTKVTDLAPLASLTALRYLNLDGTKVSDLAPLASLTALQYLHLNVRKVTDLAPLASLTALQYLHLNRTQVADLAPLARLTALESLSLSGTQITDLAPLASLTALQYLHLDRTQIADLAPLAHLTALDTLYLSGTRITDLAPLANLTALQYLHLNRTQVAGIAPLASLTALQDLDLGRTGVTDLTPLATLPSLNRLTLTGLPEGIEAVLPRRPEIEIIR